MVKPLIALFFSMAHGKTGEARNSDGANEIRNPYFIGLSACAISFFQWRTNGANRNAPSTETPIERSMAQELAPLAPSYRRAMAQGHASS
jgi:hypothetical protein